MNEQGKNIFIVTLTMLVVWLGIKVWRGDETPVPVAPQARSYQMNTIPLSLSRKFERKEPSINIDAPEVLGSLSLVGGIINSWSLMHYSVSPDSKPINLFSSGCHFEEGASADGIEGQCDARWWWMGSGSEEKKDSKGPSDEKTSREKISDEKSGTGQKEEKEGSSFFPTPSTLWKASGLKLTPTQPITLSWENQFGVLFKIIYAFEKPYLLKVTQLVINQGDKPLSVRAVQSLARHGKLPNTSNMVVRTGLLGMFEGRLLEKGYDDVGDHEAWRPLVRSEGSGQKDESLGWVGMSENYWLSAIVPQSSMTLGQGSSESTQKKAETSSRLFKGQFFKGLSPNGETLRFVQTRSPHQVIQPGQTHRTESLLFVGPKSLKILDQYEKALNICHFDLAVDFGWFYFLTKPFFWVLSWLNDLMGGFGAAILVFTVLIKLCFLPLSIKSYRSMARMRDLKPKIEALKAKFSSDKMRFNQEMMALYQREKVNPVSGCWPMLVQIPIFFSLYKVLMISLEMRHAKFLWVRDLSAPDHTSLLHGFGLWSLPFELPSFLHIGIWPLLMTATIFLHQKTTTGPAMDRQQEIVMTYFLPIMFTFMMLSSPVGLLVYWTWSNLLSFAQQWILVKYFATHPSSVTLGKKK